MSKREQKESRALSPFERRLKAIYRNYPSTSLKPLLKRFRAGKEKGLPKETGSVRRECLALAAYFIEPIWKHTKAWINLHPPGLAKLEEGPDENLVAVPNGEIDILDWERAHTPAEAIEILNQGMMNALYVGHETVWQQLIEEEQKAEPEQNYEYQVYKRYESKLAEMRPGKETDPASHIQIGMLVGLRVIGSLFAALPLVIQREEHRQIGVEEAKVILQNSFRTIRVMASMYVNTLNQADRGMREGVYDIYDAKNLVLVGEGSERRLEPAPHIHEALTAIPSEGERRTGCPALYAEGDEGKTVMEEFFAWYMQVAEKYYLPRMAEFTENALLMEMTDEEIMGR